MTILGQCAPEVFEQHFAVSMEQVQILTEADGL